MSSSFWDSVRFWRPFVLLCCVVAVVLGVRGVTGGREFAFHCGVEIPRAWYAFATLPPLIIAIAAVAAPRALFGAVGSWRCTAIVCITLLFGGTEPLIYMLYHLDERTHAYLHATPASQHR